MPQSATSRGALYLTLLAWLPEVKKREIEEKIEKLLKTEKGKGKQSEKQLPA